MTDDARSSELSDALAKLISDRVASGDMRVVALTGCGGLKDIAWWLEQFGIIDVSNAAVAVIALKEEQP